VITLSSDKRKAIEQRVQEQTAELAQANAALQDALGQAQVLLRELHHRVKNNLQVIASLLNLQSASLQDPHIQAIFQDCQARIRAMALVHELLYQSRNLGRIKLAHYLEALAKQLYGSYRIDPRAGSPLNPGRRGVAGCQCGNPLRAAMS
jgi:two-component sensor histidine kinase